MGKTRPATWGKTEEIVRAWLRDRNAMFTFTYRDILKITEVGESRASQIISTLISDRDSGVSRDKLGVYRYDPEYDKHRPGMPSGSGLRVNVIGLAAEFMESNPGRTITIDAAARETNLQRGSLSAALLRLSENPGSGIRKIARGTYKYIAPADSGYSSDPPAAEQAARFAEFTEARNSAPAATMMTHEAPSTGDLYEGIGRTNSGEVIVRSTDGILSRLVPL